MQLTQWISIGCFILGVPQAISAIIQLMEWRRIKAENLTATGRTNPVILALLMLTGTFLAMAFGFWLLYHPIAPAVIEKPTVIEKLAPCPTPDPQKTGDATTSGADSPATTGNGNSTTYGTPAPTAKSPHPKSNR
jgi:hypothetical protein